VEQREYAEIARSSAESLLTIINDILDFSKIEAGQLDLERAPFNLRSCLESTLDLAAATLQCSRAIDLAYEWGQDTPEAVVGDVTRLRQILLNLLSNALKFTEQGEVVVTVGSRLLDGGAYELQFAVRDTGIGIPPIESTDCSGRSRSWTHRRPASTAAPVSAWSSANDWPS
jgi:signal transduction histidine kinase